MKLEIWSDGGKSLSRHQGLKDLSNILAECLIPGTALEAVWNKINNTLYVYEVTYQGIDESRLVVNENPTPDTEGKPLRLDQVPRETGDRMLEEGNVAQIDLTNNIPFYDPLIAAAGDDKTLRLPPDDWALEFKAKGDRILVFAQPTEGYLAMDLRRVPYEVRTKIRAKIVSKIAHKHIKSVPTAEFNFPRAFEEWKEYSCAAGVVAKLRNSYYLPTDRDHTTKAWRELIFGTVRQT